MEYMPGIWNHVSIIVIELEPETELEPESEPRLLPKVME